MGSVVITSPESPPSNISCTCLFLCLFYYRERLCEYCTGVNKKIHMLSLKNAQMQGPLGLDQDCVAAANSLRGPRRGLHEWWLLMRPRSCLATVSINFCLSRSFFRNCANMLFLRLVSFILNREEKKEGKMFEEILEGELVGGRML